MTAGDVLTPEQRAAAEQGAVIARAVAAAEAIAFSDGVQVGHALATRGVPLRNISAQYRSVAEITVTAASAPPKPKPRRWVATGPDGKQTTIEAVES